MSALEVQLEGRSISSCEKRISCNNIEFERKCSVNSFALLPDEIVFKICSYLDPETYFRLKTTDSFFFKLLPELPPVFLSFLENLSNRNLNSESQNKTFDSLIDLAIREDLSITENDSMLILRLLWKKDLIAFTDRDISDLSVLSAFTNLETLILSSTQVSNISTLSVLTKLQVLYLSCTQVSDISALAPLLNLTHLYLGSNQISDISALSQLTNLQVLDLSDTQVSNVTVLLNLTNLKFLHLTGSHVTDRFVVSELKARGVRVFGPS
mmetsp:Transcript_2698/g.4753  ORF Transcript_2698/g.4753 Transcript_2698/m.4753 type:complete len:268 (-) Transcript_2698:728-1531(-)